MSLETFPDEVILMVLRTLLHNGQPRTLKPSPDTFCYDSNIQYILTSLAYGGLINISLTCRKLRGLTILLLRDFYQNSLQISFARKIEVPHLIQYKSFENKQLSTIPFQSKCQFLLSKYVTNLELCLSFLRDKTQWGQIVATFENIESLKILGNAEHYQRIFEYNDYSEQFSKLRKMTFLFPGSSLAFEGFAKCIDWKSLIQMNLFIDPYGNLAINVIDDLINRLIFKLSTNKVQKLYLVGGNNVIYNNYILLVKLAQLLATLDSLKTLSISHNRMKAPTFSVFVRSYDNQIDYYSISDPFINFFKTIGQLQLLETLVLDTDILRQFDKEIIQLFYQIKFHQQHELELILREPTFIYPISSEQLNQILRLVLVIRPTSLSFKLGVQIELNVANSIMLLVHQLLSQLTKKFNYTRIRYVDYELCWSIMEDSYILEHNTIHEEDKILRWQRPQLASSVYRRIERQYVSYLNTYDEEADYVKLMDSDLIRYSRCTYEIKNKGNNELKRLKFWELACLLDDITIFNNLGSRKGSIFD